MSDEGEEKDSQITGFIIVMLACAFLGFMLGAWVSDTYFKRETVERGAARWVITDDSGAVKWEWILAPKGAK